MWFSRRIIAKKKNTTLNAIICPNLFYYDIMALKVTVFQTFIITIARPWNSPLVFDTDVSNKTARTLHSFSHASFCLQFRVICDRWVIRWPNSPGTTFSLEFISRTLWNNVIYYRRTHKENTCARLKCSHANLESVKSDLDLKIIHYAFAGDVFKFGTCLFWYTFPCKTRVNHYLEILSRSWP